LVSLSFVVSRDGLVRWADPERRSGTSGASP
jgi:hypothetical protein